LVNNSAALKKKTEMRKKYFNKKIAEAERDYEKAKSDIEFKVANRPLLVE